MINSHAIEAKLDKVQVILNMKPTGNVKEVRRLDGCMAALRRFMSNC